jgi:integrase
MARAKDWTVREVAAAKHPGTKPGGKPVPVLFRVSAGLYLQVTPAGAKSWIFRFKAGKRARQMGLGPAGDDAGAVLLADARAAVGEARALIRAGLDPIDQRREARRQVASEGRTFREVADMYRAAHEAGWRNAKHRQQWANTLAAFVLPSMGDLPVAAIGTGEVMGVLETLWQSRPETASRVRGRIEAVLDYATARGWRSGENPARWRGHLANVLPKRSRVRAVEHQPACDWREVGAFVAALREREALGARAIEWLLLTATRSGETVGARWGEVDRVAKVWTVPASRMKAGREHRVPLSGAALALLDGLAQLHGGRTPAADAFLFPGERVGKPLSAAALQATLDRMNPHEEAAPARWRDRRSGRPITLHGFRSTFRDWCGEALAVPREVAEAALAHALRDKVEAAYARADLLERRRQVMEQWAAHLARGDQPGGAVADLAQLRQVRAGAA